MRKYTWVIKRNVFPEFYLFLVADFILSQVVLPLEIKLVDITTSFHATRRHVKLTCTIHCCVLEFGLNFPKRVAIMLLVLPCFAAVVSTSMMIEILSDIGHLSFFSLKEDGPPACIC